VLGIIRGASQAHILAEVPIAEGVRWMRKPLGIHGHGPLEPFVPGFLEELARQGYSPWSAASYLVVIRHLSRWLGDHDGLATKLTPDRVREFVTERRARGYAKGRSTQGLVRVITSYLRKIGVVPEAASPVPETHLERVLHELAVYLFSERGLAHRTIPWYRYWRVGSCPLAKSALASADTSSRI